MVERQIILDLIISSLSISLAEPATLLIIWARGNQTLCIIIYLIGAKTIPTKEIFVQA
jgi:hypothetical protein